MLDLASKIWKKCGILSIGRSIASHNLGDLSCDDATLSQELDNLSEENVSVLIHLLAEKFA